VAFALVSLWYRLGFEGFEVTFFLDLQVRSPCRIMREKQINYKLRAVREQRHWSMEAAAAAVGVSKTTFLRWENGEQEPHGSTLDMLCRAFGRSDEDLGYPRGNLVSINREIESPLRFLSMNVEELIKRYEDEKEYLLELKAEHVQWTLPEVVIFDNTRSRLPITAIAVQIDKSHPEYTIPATIAGKAENVLEEIEHYFYDSTTIRLNGMQKDGNSLILTVAKAHYLQYIATNYAMDAFLRKKGWTRSLRDTVHATARLCKLEESLLANHLGVNTLVFTIDNYLVLPQRAKENLATWRETVSPSISGATCYDDDMYHQKMGPVASWIREGREELGLDYSDFREEKDIFLGITRDLLRGGKPEMFFATQIGVTRGDLERKFKKARDKWENRELQWLEFTNPLTPSTTKQEHAIFMQEFLTLLNLHKDQLSRPVQVNLALWFKYMECP